jgi:hypothetical protein
MAATWRRWRPLPAALLTVLLLAVFLGGGRAGAGTEPRATTRTVIIPVSAFSPRSDTIAFSLDHNFLETGSGGGEFLAAVFFEAPTVTIKKVVFYAIDAGTGYLQMSLFRTKLATQEHVRLGVALTSGSSHAVEVVTLSDLSARRITGAYGATLSVYLPAPYSDGYRFLGAKVTYSY